MKHTVYDLWKKNKQNILLTSDGGMGKTTQLINCFRKLLSKDEYTEVPIYIDVKSIEYNEKKPIFRYLYSTYCGKINSIENIDEKIIRSLNLEKEDKLIYVFIVDGLNETTNKGNILNDIKKLKKFNCCRFIVSSRIVEEDYVFDDFVKLKLLPLEKREVSDYIREKFEVIDTNEIGEFDGHLYEIISNPLFLDAFCRAYKSKKMQSMIKEGRKIRKANILHAYCHKMLQEIKERTIVEENNIIEFTIKFFLPRIAFMMLKENKFMISHKRIIEWLFDKSDQKAGEEYFRNLMRGKDFTRYMKVFSNNIDNIIEYCLSSSLVKYIENRDSYIFSHHIWRDYFASQHILNLINSSKIDELIFLPDELMIKEFVGELINLKGLSECDFDSKQDCFGDMSPIESFMQSKYLLLNQEPEVTGNLIEIMKIARNANITACYDNLDLRWADFVGCKLPNSSFNNSKIYESNFYAQGHSGYVYAATITPDNKRIISCGKDSTIRIWDVLTQRQIGEPLRGHDNYVVSVKTINDGQEIISGSYDGTIRRWCAETHKQIGSPLLGHTKRINQITVTSNEKYVVSCSSDATIRIWCLHSGMQDGEALCGHNGVVNGICISPDERYIVSAGEDGTVRLWDFLTHKQSGSPLLGHNCSVKSVCVTADGKYIVSADQKGKVCIWDIETRKQVGNALQCSPDSIESIAVLLDGSTIIAAGYDGKIRAFDIGEGTLIAQIDAHGDWINGIGISDDGKFIVSAGGDQAIKLWDAKTLELVGKPFVGTDSWINSVKITSDSQFIISAGDDAAIRIWSVPQKRMVCEPRYGHTARINEIDISADGIIVSASDDGKVGMWNINNKSETTLLNGHSSWVRTVILSENGEYAISGGWDRNIIKWDLKHGEIVKELPGHNASVEALALVNDDGLLISGSDDETIRFWDVKKGDQCEDPIEAHDDWIRALKLTHDKKRIVTASWDNTIRIWDVDSHEMIGEPLKGHNNRIDALDVSKDGVIISGSDDNTVRAWEKNNGIYAATIIANHSNAVSGVSISDDSKFVVSGDGSGIIKISYLDSEESSDVIRQLRLNVFNSDLSNIRDDSEVSKDFLGVLYQNGCLF